MYALNKKVLLSHVFTYISTVAATFLQQPRAKVMIFLLIHKKSGCFSSCRHEDSMIFVRLKRT